VKNTQPSMTLYLPPNHPPVIPQLRKTHQLNCYPSNKIILPEN
jgi:hypothetical protein